MRKIENVTTHELRVGDVLLCHGLELVIDQEIKQSKGHPVTDYGGACLYTAARVINWEEAQADKRIDPLLLRFIREDMADESHRTRNGLAPYTEPRWTIQGNGLARWSRVIN